MSPRLSANRRSWLVERLSLRDHLVLDQLAALRLATGQQLEVLCFQGMVASSRPVVRGRVLGRLVRWQVLEVVERRIGGASRGSTSAVYRLTATGKAVAAARTPRANRPYSDRFTAHTLLVSQLAVDLTLLTRTHRLSMPVFTGEPASWVEDGIGGYLKPDAYAQLRRPGLTVHYWAEIDRATEAAPRLRQKLTEYLDFVERGGHGPRGVVPQIVLSVPDERRLAAIRRLLERLPEPASELFVTAQVSATAETMLKPLLE